MTEVKDILIQINAGDAKSTDQLLSLVYDELRKLAEVRLAREQPGQTLQPTALVHEAYLRLIGGTEGQQWDGSGHFFAAAAEAMRRILIDRARRKQRPKHGGGRARVDFEGIFPANDAEPESILAMDEALSKLSVESQQKAELVKLRFFGGLSLKQAASALGISDATAKRYWAYARAFLYSELSN